MQAYYNAQIEPHFLMNTLNAIRSLIRINPEKARSYVTYLGEFMRETQQYARKEHVSLANEIAQAQRYMDFQRLRFPNKITYHIHCIDKNLLTNTVPPRTLLTLLENCLTHGRKPDKKLLISIRVYYDINKNNVIFEIEDNGKGIPLKRLQNVGKKPLYSEHKGGGRALYNLTQSFQYTFGNRVYFDVISKEGKGTLIRLIFPSKINN
jgi:two-component system sensor histidine kinase LytS